MPMKLTCLLRLGFLQTFDSSITALKGFWFAEDADWMAIVWFCALNIKRIVDIQAQHFGSYSLFLVYAYYWSH
jgi:hypothetical protein